MPISLDYQWLETNTLIELTFHLPVGTAVAQMVVDSTPVCLTINIGARHVLVLDLLHEIDDSKTRCSVAGRVVTVSMRKLEAGVWGTLCGEKRTAAAIARRNQGIEDATARLRSDLENQAKTASEVSRAGLLGVGEARSRVESVNARAVVEIEENLVEPVREDDRRAFAMSSESAPPIRRRGVARTKFAAKVENLPARASRTAQRHAEQLRAEASVLVTKAMNYSSSKDWESAATAFGEARLKDAKNLKLAIAHAVSALYAKDYEVALLAAESGLELASREGVAPPTKTAIAQLHSQRMHALAGLGRPSAAATAGKIAIQLLEGDDDLIVELRNELEIDVAVLEERAKA